MQLLVINLLANHYQLFAAASLKSASILLPIACEMSIRGTNTVHFALMGRDDISIDELKSVNGITNDCKIAYHGMYHVTFTCIPYLILYRWATRYVPPELGYSHGSQLWSSLYPHKLVHSAASNFHRCLWRRGSLFGDGIERPGQFTRANGD